MRKASFYFAALVLLAGFLFAPVEPSFDLRNKAGDIALSFDAPGVATVFYQSTAIQGSLRGDNNLNVIGFARTRRNRSKMSKKAYARAFFDAQFQFQRLAGNGIAAAQYNLGLMSFGCRVSSKCYEDGKVRLRRAEVMGDPLAPLARALQLSIKSEADAGEKARLLKKLADDGDAYAALQYHDMFRHSDSEELRQEADRYLNMAAEGGLFYAQEILAAKRDRKDRKIWLEKAAAGGSVMAAYRLGEYFDVPKAGKNPNLDLGKAASWYQRAIHIEKTRDESPHSLSQTIEIHPAGLRYRKVRRSQRFSSLNRSHLAAYRLGEMYLHGLGVASDKDKAETSFRYAALAPVKDSGVIAAQRDFELKPEYYIETAHLRRVGLESALHLENIEGAKLPPALEAMLLQGKLRVMTQWDLANWRQSQSGKIDRRVVETLANPRIANRALVVLADKISLPSIPKIWKVMPVIKIRRKQVVENTSRGYRLYSIVPARNSGNS